MKLNELIEKLEIIRKIEGGDIECCTYDSIIEDYTNSLCLEVVDDDYYIKDSEEQVWIERILLF